MDRMRLLAIARKEVLQLRRDPRSLILAFLLPVAAAGPLRLRHHLGRRATSALAVVDQDRTARSRELVDAFRASGCFRRVAAPARTADIGPLLDRGRARLALVIPPGFAADLGAGRTAAVQAIVDGSDANTATIALGYAQAIVQQHSARVLLQSAAPAPAGQRRDAGLVQRGRWRAAT